MYWFNAVNHILLINQILAHNYPTKLGETYDADPSLVVPTIFPQKSGVEKNEIGEAIKLIYLSDDSETWKSHPGRVIRVIHNFSQ